jgi:hypothetical protein
MSERVYSNSVVRKRLLQLRPPLATVALFAIGAEALGITNVDKASGRPASNVATGNSPMKNSPHDRINPTVDVRYPSGPAPLPSEVKAVAVAPHMQDCLDAILKVDFNRSFDLTAVLGSLNIQPPINVNKAKFVANKTLKSLDGSPYFESAKVNDQNRVKLTQNAASLMINNLSADYKQPKGAVESITCAGGTLVTEISHAPEAPDEPLIDQLTNQLSEIVITE